MGHCSCCSIPAEGVSPPIHDAMRMPNAHKVDCCPSAMVDRVHKVMRMV